jgi:DNA repair photolyase
MIHTLRPPVVYVSDRVRADARCRARLERMMGAIECDRVIDVTDEDIEQLVEEQGWSESRRQTGRVKTGDPPILFNRYRWLSDDALAAYAERFPDRSGSQFFGFRPFTMRRREKQLHHQNIVCQSAWEIHSVTGCLFKCAYCSFENFLNIMLDLEEWADRLERLVDETPWQALYKYDNMSDILTFEPEYGASELLVPLFARKPNAYLMHYTKSAHVDHLLDLDHRGHTLMCWSLSGHTQSREIEVDAATCEERIDAARKCQEAGYPVRFRFSPIVPIRGWREEVRAMIDRLLATVRPEVLSLQTLSRFPEYDIVERVFDTDIFAPRFLDAMRSRPADVQGKLYGPIPHDLRKEVYEFCIDEIRRRNPGVPVSLCLESTEMWDDLEETLGIDRERYPCCCGPVCVPGDPVMTRKDPS